MIRTLRARLSGLRALVRALGSGPALAYLWRRRGAAELLVHPHEARHPLVLRTGTSDEDVLRQVFGYRQYAPVADLTDVGLVIDCGANVGYSSANFLTQFPACTLLAVEPDPGSFDLLRRNLGPYGPRATAVFGAVWSHRCGLKLSRDPYQDGREWTRQVLACGEDEEAELPGFDIPSLVKMTRYERISLLKVDIEGAEVVLFGPSADPWLACVDNLVIELHDDTRWGNASDVFFRAIAGRGFDVTQHGELTICRN